MTAQVPDSIIYEGGTYPLHSLPLGDYFDGEHPQPDFRPSSTGCWRGYIACWEVKGDWLYLVGIKAWLKQYDSAVGIEKVFPETRIPLKATWFSGQIRLQKGEMIEYAHYAFASTYEEEILLTIKNGQIVKSELRDNRPLDSKSSEETFLQRLRKAALKKRHRTPS